VKPTERRLIDRQHALTSPLEIAYDDAISSDKGLTNNSTGILVIILQSRVADPCGATSPCSAPGTLGLEV
jgi:hypothetical protein